MLAAFGCALCAYLNLLPLLYAVPIALLLYRGQDCTPWEARARLRRDNMGGMLRLLSFVMWLCVWIGTLMFLSVKLLRHGVDALVVRSFLDDN